MTKRLRVLAIFLVGAILPAGSIFCSGCGVILDLLVTPEIEVSTHELIFDATEMETVPSQQITASCTQTDTDTFVENDCGANVTSNQEWLTVSPDEIYGLETVTVSVNIEGLAPGTYEGNIHVEYWLVAIDDEEDVRVELTVNEADPI